MRDNNKLNRLKFGAPAFRKSKKYFTRVYIYIEGKRHLRSTRHAYTFNSSIAHQKKNNPLFRLNNKKTRAYGLLPKRTAYYN